MARPLPLFDAVQRRTVDFLPLFTRALLERWDLGYEAFLQVVVSLGQPAAK